MKNWFVITLAALSLTSVAVADSVELTVHSDQTTKTISTGIYGQFLEHIFNSVHGGLWGDQILNGTLELSRPAAPRRRPGGNATTNGPAAARRDAPRELGIRRRRRRSRHRPGKSLQCGGLRAHRGPKAGGDQATGPGIRQRNIALQARRDVHPLALRARQRRMSATFDDEATHRRSPARPSAGLTGQMAKVHRRVHRASALWMPPP